MGGFFGAVSNSDVILDVFFGVDYHSHLGTRRGGMAAYNPDDGFQREIHNIENSPFRTKFENIKDKMRGNSAIGCISDTDPQPILICSKLGNYAIATIGKINNSDQIVKKYLSLNFGHFSAMTGGRVNANEVVSAIINQCSSFVEGLKHVHEVIDGTASILILKEDGNIIAARDKLGRLPIVIGKKTEGNAFCVSFEDFAYHKLGYEDYKELGPGEIVEISPDGVEQLAAPGNKMKICAFLWSYYGYPTSTYEGRSVEMMRYRNGEIMAEYDIKNGKLSDIDYVGGVPDSGTPHAIGYALRSRVPFARPFIKYTPTWPRSFMPTNQQERERIAKMKQIPVKELIEGKKLLFVDDSIVRGTQLRETVDFLYANGAKEVHIRSACPPLMYGCKYLNFSTAKSDMELLARSTVYNLEGEEGLRHIEEYGDADTERGQIMRCTICKKLHFSSLEFQQLEGIVESIGIGADNICTYCWNGKE